MAWLWDNGKRKVNFADAIQPYINDLQTSFQNNINALYNKLVSLGSTPASKSPSAISNAIQAINDSIYNKLVSLGQTPASKTVENLNAKIQALTQVTWAYNASYSLNNYNYLEGFYDATNIQRLDLTSIDLGSWGGQLIVRYYNASNTQIDIDIATSAKTFSIRSGTKRIKIEIVNLNSATVKFTYQTKVLR